MVRRIDSGDAAATNADKIDQLAKDRQERMSHKIDTELIELTSETVNLTEEQQYQKYQRDCHSELKQMMADAERANVALDPDDLPDE
jgi:hypothetical protein